MSDQQEYLWLSLGRISHWVWEKSFTKQGTFIFTAFSLALGICWYSDAHKPWMVLFAPLAIIVIGFVLFLVSIVGVFGDSFADWAIGKIFKSPNPKNPSHQLLYLLLSTIGFVFAAIIIDIGDPHVQGYWHH